jgi:SAM-dependent methyltransferase
MERIMLETSFGDLSDNQWLDTLAASEFDPSLGLPGFPPAQIQANFTGRHGRPALEEAFELYSLIKKSAGRLDGPVLDFGVGWGRILRFFIKDLPAQKLHGVDIEPTAIEECRAAKLPAQLSLLKPGEPLPYADGTFQIVYAYSVFTHLPAKAAKRAIDEIKRVLRPDGKIIFTALTARYLRLCVEYDTFPSGTWQKSMASAFPNPRALLEKYEAGEFVYSPIGGGGALTDDIYGWAAVPKSIMADDWGLKIEQAHDDGSRFLQGAFVAKRA